MNLYTVRIYVMRLSITSPSVLTSTDLQCKKWWNASSKEISDQMWIPFENNLTDTCRNKSEFHSSNLITNSWFTAKIQYPVVSDEKNHVSYTSFKTSAIIDPAEEKCKKRKFIKLTTCTYIDEKCQRTIDDTTNNFYCELHYNIFVEQNTGSCRATSKSGRGKGTQCQYYSVIIVCFDICSNRD